jgi:hypothetical protein
MGHPAPHRVAAPAGAAALLALMGASPAAGPRVAEAARGFLGGPRRACSSCPSSG